MQRILVVEDNKTLANLIAKKIQTELQCDVDVAYKLSEAKLFAKRYKYFVALCDLNLPDAPNGEVVDYLLTHDTKVVVLSGNIDKDFRQEMLKKNIIDYIKKSGAGDLRFILSMLKRLDQNQKHTILVVDDSMVVRNQLKTLLENVFFKVITVAHGEEALGILATHPEISLVITDYNMPVMNGLDLTKEIRKDHDKNHISIITLSSENDDETIALFLKNGANDYMKKPFSKEEFYCRIHNTIESLENVQLILNNANRDFLTGLYNRRYFYDHINSLTDKANDSFTDLYIAMVDIDNFKSINDTYGHDEGDKAIISLSEILRTNTKQQDLVARFGGEEFCLAILCRDEATALEIFERIRQGVENFSFTTKDNQEIRFTISIGVTKYSESDSIDDVINQADMNLYTAKNTGKNKVVYEVK